MTTPLGTPRKTTIRDTTGATHVTTVWPAGVAGLGLTPDSHDPMGKAWRVVHLGSGMILAQSRDLGRATYMAHQFAYACRGRQVGELSLITDDANLMRVMAGIARLYA